MKPLRTMNIDLATFPKKKREEYPYSRTIPDYIQDVKTCVNSLSDAGKRLFKRVLSANRPYPRALTRHEIARLIGHQKMLPHDIRLLNEMVALGLLGQDRRSRKRLANGMPNGFEYVYTIPSNVLWACNELSHAQTTPKKATDTPTPPPKQSAPTLKDSIDLDKWRDARDSKRRGLFGWLRGK